MALSTINVPTLWWIISPIVLDAMIHTLVSAGVLDIDIVVYTKLDFYVFIAITESIPLLLGY